MNGSNDDPIKPGNNKKSLKEMIFGDEAEYDAYAEYLKNNNQIDLEIPESMYCESRPGEGKRVKDVLNNGTVNYNPFSKLDVSALIMSFVCIIAIAIGAYFFVHNGGETFFSSDEYEYDTAAQYSYALNNTLEWTSGKVAVVIPTYYGTTGRRDVTGSVVNDVNSDYKDGRFTSIAISYNEVPDVDRIAYENTLLSSGFRKEEDYLFGDMYVATSEISYCYKVVILEDNTYTYGMTIGDYNDVFDIQEGRGAMYNQE